MRGLLVGFAFGLCALASNCATPQASSESADAAAVERLLAQKARKLGLRPEFPFQRLADWASTHGGAELIERRKVKPFGVYTLVRFRRAEAQSVAA